MLMQLIEASILVAKPNQKFEQIMGSLSLDAEVVEIQNQSASADMFSLLPDDLLVHIISFLPVKYAVFTSILSKRWKCLWCYAGNSLEFDDEGISYRESAFPNFVDRVLSLYRVPTLKKFTLLCNGYMMTQSHYWCHQSWIDHALRQQKANEVEIYLGRWVEDGTLLSVPVFSSDTLQVLKLECPPGVLSLCGNLCLPNLKVLHLWFDKLHLSPELFEIFFSAALRLEEAFLGATMSCSAEHGFDVRYHLQAPSLKRLRLHLQTWDISAGDFVVDAPLLEELFLDDDCFRHHVFRGMPSLITAKVNVGVPFFRKIEHVPIYFDQIDELLQRLASTKSLYLRGSTMDVISVADHHNLPKFSNLSHLHIRVLNYFSWDALPILLLHAPNLKILVLKKDFKNWYAKFNEDSNWCKPQEVPVCLSKSLSEIEIWDCEARQVELDLVSYLLQNGKVLTKFMVDLLPHRLGEESKFCKRIMMIQKGSATCQIKISTVTSCPALRSHCTGKALELLPIPQRVTYKDLSLFTDGFDSKNLISITPLSKVYRGKMPPHRYDSEVKLVTVKECRIADRDLERKYDDYVKESLFLHQDPVGKYKAFSLRCFHDELKLLQHPNFCSHPYFLRLLAYSVEDDSQWFGVIYDFEPLDILQSLIPKDSFNWLQRIKVALGLACILEYMHKKTETLPAIVRNLDAAYVMLDKDYNPVLLDFSCVSGRIFPERDTWREWLHVCQYISWTQEIDPDLVSDKYERHQDIFAYGIILLGLISKRVHERDVDKREETNDRGIYGWAEKEYRPHHLDSAFHQPKISLVHRSLKAHQTFDFVDGLKVTSIAMRCVGPGRQRPRMIGVVRCLLKLRIVKQYWDYLECDKMLSVIDL